MADTKSKILDTAEQLIATQGFAATSLRQIIAEAGVNLAAVHYHFGSKEELLDHVIARKATAVNAERLALLQGFQREAAGAPVTVENILAAFLEPMIDVGTHNPQFVQLMARMHGEGLLPAIIAKHFQPTFAHFLKALRRALPHLPEAEFYWRLQFMFGAISRAVIGPEGFPTQGIQGDIPDFACLNRRLQVFLAAGLQAPATREVAAPEEVRQ